MKYKDNVRDFYQTNAWKKTRLLALQRDYYLCQHCLKQNTIQSANVVHHIIEITNENLNEYGLDLNNLISLCRECHESLHGRLNNKEETYYFDKNGNIVPIK